MSAAPSYSKAPDSRSAHLLDSVWPCRTARSALPERAPRVKMARSLHPANLGGVPPGNYVLLARDAAGFEAWSDVTVDDPPSASIACPPAGCTVYEGMTLVLEGNSTDSDLAYHHWQWTDASGSAVNVQQDTTGSGLRSSAVFSAAGFSGFGTRLVTLLTCSDGYGIGTCVAAQRGIAILPPPPPTITCTPPDCTVTAGLTLQLTGDSSASQLRYHEWRWNDAAGSGVTVRRDTASAGYGSNVVFSAAGFSGAGTRLVTLTACSDGYGTGTCASAQKELAVIGVPSPPHAVPGMPVRSLLVLAGFLMVATWWALRRQNLGLGGRPPSH